MTINTRYGLVLAVPTHGCVQLGPAAGAHLRTSSLTGQTMRMLVSSVRPSVSPLQYSTTGGSTACHHRPVNIRFYLASYPDLARLRAREWRVVGWIPLLWHIGAVSWAIVLICARTCDGWRQIFWWLKFAPCAFWILI